MNAHLSSIAKLAGVVFGLSACLYALDLPEPIPLGSGKLGRDCLNRFKAEGATAQKWHKDLPAPTTLEEVGLRADAVLVWSASYLDGGTRGYLVQDSEGHMLALCTGPGFQTKSLASRIDAARGSRLFIGAIHYTDPGAQMIPANSYSEAFLCALLNRANKSLQPTPTAVMPPAAQEIMPAVGVAEH
jgi:hypothetical protein